VASSDARAGYSFMPKVPRCVYCTIDVDTKHNKQHKPTDDKAGAQKAPRKGSSECECIVWCGCEMTTTMMMMIHARIGGASGASSSTSNSDDVGRPLDDEFDQIHIEGV
jgi:hypothetical protein